MSGDEKYEEECPFSPNLDIAWYSSHSGEYKDEGENKTEWYQHAIQRLRKANDEKKRLATALERGEPSEYLPGGEFRYGIERTFKGAIRVTTDEAAPLPPQRISQPHSVQPKTPPYLPEDSAKKETQSAEPKEQPVLSADEVKKKLQAIPQEAEIMTVSVNVKPGQTEDLTLYEGDDLTSVVTSFAQKHGK